MNKTVLEIYALAVCFATIVCLVITSGWMSWNIIQLAAPEFTINDWEFKCHQTDQAYKDCYGGHSNLTPPFAPGKESINASAENVGPTTDRKTAYAAIISGQKRLALQGTVQKLIFMIFNLLVFVTHWRIANRARESTA